VAIGMATMAFSGAGKFKEVQDVNDLKDGSEITWINPDTGKSAGDSSSEWIDPDTGKVFEDTMSESEKEALEKYYQSLEESRKLEEELSRSEELKNDPLYRATRLRNELSKHISSSAYLNKLVTEFDGNVEKALNTQKERVNYLDRIFDNGIELEKIENMANKWALEGSGIVGRILPQGLVTKIKLHKAGLSGVGAYYITDEHKIILPDVVDDKAAMHELLHASTNADTDITEKGKALLEDSYKKLGTNGDRYFNSPTERLVRKQVLDLEMEKLGIKKYGKRFTEEHYKKLLELDKEGILSNGAHDFIRTTEPEYFERIFNELADTNKISDNNVV